MSKIKRMLPTSGIRKVFNRAKEIENEGKQVLHLEIGRTDWKLPPGVVDAAKHALDEGFVHYIANRGILDLRNTISEEIERTTGRSFDSEKELIITSGASEALSMCGLALLSNGDEVIIPEPAWPHYKAVTIMSDAIPVPLPLSSEEGFLIDPDRVKKAISKNTKMIIINTPGNPTGAVQPPEYLKEIANLAFKYGFFILSDDVYQDFVYEGEHISITKYMGDSELLLYLNSFSKSYAMTGWRIGYIAAKENISDALNRIHQYLTVCGVPFAQKGAENILINSERLLYINKMRKAFLNRYTVWKNVFTNCPYVQLVPPKGAFYIFPRIEYKGMSGREFCNYMLEEHQVAMVPGEIFGESFSQYLRISFGRDIETQRAAAKKFLEVFYD